MKPFDPFTATLEEAESQPDAYAMHGPVLRWGAALDIIARRAHYEANPLDGVAACVQAGLVAPDWLAVAFLRQYGRVLRREVATWDEAFGPAKPAGVHLSTLRLKRMHGGALYRLFSGPDKLPRTPAGFAQAAAATGLSVKQVRELLPKTRENVPASKRNAAARRADPFGRRKGPKK